MSFISSPTESSWSAVDRIQRVVYQDVQPEDLEVLKSKWLHSPQTCLIYQSDEKEVLAYLLAHTWGLACVPKLNKMLSKSDAGKVLFIHDLAVSPLLKGKGVGRAMVCTLLEKAKSLGLESAMLVAVQESEGFWSRFGFIEQVGKVPSEYGDGAKLMTIAEL